MEPSINLPRWQFGLLHIFGLTTLSAVAAALVAAYGLGTLLISIGVLIAWLNTCGAFQWFQSGRRQQALLWLAWGTFLASLALPSFTLFGPVFGVMSAWLALTMPLEALVRHDLNLLAIVVYLVIDIANVAMLLLPLLMWRVSRGHGQRLGTVLCVMMVAPWCVAWSPSGLLIGYYVWSGSLLLALIGIPVRVATLVAMVAVAVGCGLFAMIRP